jgi:hypothetical protein
MILRPPRKVTRIATSKQEPTLAHHVPSAFILEIHNRSLLALRSLTSEQKDVCNALL